ncbi:ATP-binding cassette domain-containing protein [Clostridiaceae bacterium M8S5]|nr:ATP-binding cassette domain-containing protein [Clostridiaceae bacterium M8S5]
MKKFIEIKNAKIHNLKGIDIKIPKNKLTVITGVSGSGKSSLAFDTLYEEGKRRYLMFSDAQFSVNSVSTFDSITGLSPTVAVEQRVIRQSNPRSTVGTRTRINGMLAMMFATYGKREGIYDNGEPLSMGMFQRNSPKGMCVRCLGKGIVKNINEQKIFGDSSQKVEDVCLGLGKRGKTRKMLDNFCKLYNISPTQKLSTLTEEQLLHLKYGDNGKSSFVGFIPWIAQIINGVFSSTNRLENMLIDAGYLDKTTCPKCSGAGIGEYALHIKIEGKTIYQLENMYIKDLYLFLNTLDSSKMPVLKEILVKLECMIDVGLYHLSLSRSLPTLSGGEIQRLFLASYIIAEMDSIIFVFDEPTIGLHEIEKEKLIKTIRDLIKRGNTVVAVEHDESFIRSADYIIDLGPNAGIYGGDKIFQGAFDEFLNCDNSNTAPYFKDSSKLDIKKSYSPVDNTKALKMENCNLHNLKNLSVDIPLGIMVGIAGVSGSGKSSLIADTLVPKLMNSIKSKRLNKEHFTDDLSGVEISGIDYIKKCIVIDQKPIGRSRISNPATYTGIFDRVRTLFAKESGLSIGLFSQNSEGGCKLCKGEGEIQYSIGFGNSVYVKCEACSGTGYIKEAIDVTVDGKNIKDILSMTVDEATIFFKNKDKTIENMLSTLVRVGMGYITLGQKTPTISGGESQRIKLAKELSKGKTSKGTVYIFDEPTIGLSIHDSLKLMKLIKELVSKGNSVIITEHDTYVLSNCDYIIELGIGGGTDGGNIIATGTPKQLKANNNSIIGRYLK